MKKHFDPAVTTLDDLFSRGLVISSRDFEAIKQPDRRVRLKLKRALKPAGSEEMACNCEEKNFLLAKTADGSGDRLRYYCQRSLRYLRNGATGALSDREAFAGGTWEDPACHPDNPVSWFFSPTPEQVTAWLATMETPPPGSGSYHVVLYFECTRWCSRNPSGPPFWIPFSPDESSSGVELVGICYGV